MNPVVDGVAHTGIEKQRRCSDRPQRECEKQHTGLSHRSTVYSRRGDLSQSQCLELAVDG
jgi:hypothetical protein